MKDFPLFNWIPYKILKTDDQVQCHWLNTFSQPFCEPFFEETILKCRSMDSRHAMMNSVSDLSMLKEWSKGLTVVEPDAFIFHISRCGSTLITQLLAESAQNITLSEVPFFDDLLRLPCREPAFGISAVAELLPVAINFYGQKSGTGDRLFIKTDSWHLFFYEQLRQLYPRVPFILIYRSPDEVAQSHQKKRGMQAVPGLIEPALFGFKPGEMVYNDLDQYLATVLEKYFMKLREIAEIDKCFLLLNYNEGAMTMIKKIASFINMPIHEQDMTKMAERSLYHSKNPEQRFKEEGRRIAPTYLSEAMRLYELLEKMRANILQS